MPSVMSASMPAASSKATKPAICRFGCRPSSSSCSTSRPPVEVRERVEEIAPRLAFDVAETPTATYQAAPPNFIFQNLSEDDLSRIGVTADWLSDIRGATEDRYFEIAGHLPGEAAEALLEYAATGMLPARPPVIAPSAKYDERLESAIRGT